MFEAEATARRASLPTVPETEARKQASSSAGDCMLDQPKLTWAVDLGKEVRAMTTFDLWYALSAGDISCDAKVWRVGREAWTSALEVPELACALADVDELVPSRQTLDYVAQPPSFGADKIERVVSGVEVTDIEIRAAETSLPAAETTADRESHEEVFEHELESAREETDLTPSADLPMGQVISLHPSSELASNAPVQKRRAVAALFAVAATLAVGFSFLVAFAAPSVSAEASNAALLPSEPEAARQPAAAMFDMEAEALAEASSRRVAERLAQELEPVQAEVVRRVKSWRTSAADQKTWSPSEKGQKRKRATGKPASKKSAQAAGPKAAKLQQNQPPKRR
jgi:hypothetical protein